ncbi:MAG: DUF86 domain-containing protein [Clostridia bacterium]|nr:DUF86 domain-containing protein [Clostridia bacterium]MBR0406410.1 DUF86 domain-containing protein [Clostridia bacterium]
MTETLQEISFDQERFLTSHTYRNAVAMCILQIGELVKQLSDGFVKEYPGIPWKMMARTRDQYAHHYGNMDFSMLWDTATQDIPGVYSYCKLILSQK